MDVYELKLWERNTRTAQQRNMLKSLLLLMILQVSCVKKWLPDPELNRGPAAH